MAALRFITGVLLFFIIFVAGECFITQQRVDLSDMLQHSTDSDGSDRSLCGGTRFSCRSVKRCLPHSWKCDGEDDCGDNSDEENCQNQTDQIRVHAIDSDDGSLCGSTRFSCHGVMRCVSLTKQCDGNDDCGDNSDEENC